MPPNDTYSDPLEILAFHGVVIVQPQIGGAVAITPEAALETARRLQDAAARSMSGELASLDWEK
jgi:hypothetical protein